MIWVSIVFASGACLALAGNVLAVAFKAKNDLPTTWADVMSMAIWSCFVSVVMVGLIVAGAIA